MGRRANALSRHVERAAKQYSRRVAEFNSARAEVDVKRRTAVNPADVQEQDAALAVQAAELRSVRETLVDSCRSVGLGFDLPEVVN
jgi:hypothetical protein